MGKKILKTITLRLTEEERELLKILNAALKVSEYTDDVETRSIYRREEAMKRSMIELFTTLTGLSVISNDLPAKVKEQLKNRDLPVSILAPVVQRFFEVGRRFKRMNPDKMRSEYGKLVMLLQDAARPSIKEALGMDLLVPIQTVGSALKKIDCLDLLDDSNINGAVLPLPTGYSQKQLDVKNKCVSAIIEKWGADDANKRAIIERCILSIGDAISLIEGNCALVDKMIFWLEKYFGNRMANPNKKFDLTIRRGEGGSCLSHSHQSQFNYVKEALTLWEIVQRDIFEFWRNVEEDMLITNPGYRNTNTGQGVHRVSPGPSTAGLMHECVARADRKMGGWVGIKVVHMGDQDVPNPLVFIDKYTIIPRLLGPIVHTVEELELEFGLATSRESARVMMAKIAADAANAADDDDEQAAEGEETKKDVTASSDEKKERNTTNGDDDEQQQPKTTTTDTPTTTTSSTGYQTRGEKYPGYRELLSTGFENGEDLVIAILRDFYRHGFDGSGDDGGSCIDGRLTSAWNWCSELHKKPYYQAFLLTGFVGFDANYS